MFGFMYQMHQQHTLRKHGGSQGMLAEILVDVRGVTQPACHQIGPFKRGASIKTVLVTFRDGPKRLHSSVMAPLALVVLAARRFPSGFHRRNILARNELISL